MQLSFVVFVCSSLSPCRTGRKIQAHPINEEFIECNSFSIAFKQSTSHSALTQCELCLVTTWNIRTRKEKSMLIGLCFLSQSLSTAFAQMKYRANCCAQIRSSERFECIAVSIGRTAIGHKGRRSRKRERPARRMGRETSDTNTTWNVMRFNLFTAHHISGDLQSKKMCIFLPLSHGQRTHSLHMESAIAPAIWRWARYKARQIRSTMSLCCLQAMTKRCER